MATGKMNRSGTRRRRPHKISRTYTSPRPHAAPAVQSANARLETLAVYRPTSLFLILLIATVVPRGAFSLRLLALGGGGSCGEEAAGLASLLPWSWFGTDRADGGAGPASARPPRRGAPSWRAGALDPAPPCDASGREGGADGSALSGLWEDVSSALYRSAGDVRVLGSSMAEDADEEDWLADVQSNILGVPRGGGPSNFESDDSASYSGLVNLGNTCYLNRWVSSFEGPNVIVDVCSF